MKTIIILLIVSFGFLPMQIHWAIPFNSDFCDKIFAANFEMQVDWEFPECKNRFKWNVNQITSSFKHN